MSLIALAVVAVAVSASVIALWREARRKNRSTVQYAPDEDGDL
jgi:hypothetical protein